MQRPPPPGPLHSLPTGAVPLSTDAANPGRGSTSLRASLAATTATADAVWTRAAGVITVVVTARVGGRAAGKFATLLALSSLPVLAGVVAVEVSRTLRGSKI